jgi:hypothetical protein
MRFDFGVASLQVIGRKKLNDPERMIAWSRASYFPAARLRMADIN